MAGQRDFQRKTQHRAVEHGNDRFVSGLKAAQRIRQWRWLGTAIAQHDVRRAEAFIAAAQYHQGA